MLQQAARRVLCQARASEAPFGCQALSAAVQQRVCSSATSSSSSPKLPPEQVLHGVQRVVPRSGWAAVPPVPKFLGLTGLLPFYALSPPLIKSAAAALSSVHGCEALAHALLADLYPAAGVLQIGYGTAIVSFLGAVHWGAAMQSRTGHTTKIMFERYIWSVMPALMVFPASAAGLETGSVIVTSALIATFAIDAKFNWKGALPKWYLSLRVPLTLGSISAMIMTTWHLQSARQAVLDYEHAISEVPLTLDAEDAVLLR